MNAEPERSSAEKSAAARLFDIRLLIGGLFLVYGVMLTVDGLFFVTEAELTKAVGININLWLGVGMLAVGALFLLWRRLSPTETPSDAADAGPGAQKSARPRR